MEAKEDSLAPLKKAGWNRKKSRKTACFSASKEGMGKSFLTSSKKADRKEGKSRRATNFSASKEEMLPRAFFLLRLLQERKPCRKRQEKKPFSLQQRKRLFCRAKSNIHSEGPLTFAAVFSRKKSAGMKHTGAGIA